MSSLTGAGFTATQYALFSSLYAIPGRLLASQSGRIVESAARAADSGGTLSYLNGLFANLGPGSFATAVERSGVSPAALGTGYVVFFTYTALTGVLGIVLAIVVWRRERRSTHEVEAVPPRVRVG
jgi:PAT family beta-lactamase induction signal transducer AmpG